MSEPYRPPFQLEPYVRSDGSVVGEPDPVFSGGKRQPRRIRRAFKPAQTPQRASAADRFRERAQMAAMFEKWPTMNELQRQQLLDLQRHLRGDE